MNIGIVTTWFERGAAYVSKQFMEVLQKEHNVFIYARSGEEYAIDDPNWNMPNVYWSKRINSPFVVTVIDKKEFIKWIKSNNIETIIFNEQHWWYPIVWCKQLNIKIIAYIDYYTEQTLPLFGAYDFLICNTKRHFEAFSWHKGAKYIPWGTDVELFKPKENNEIEEAITFFHSCGYSPNRKGTDLLLKSLPLIKGKKFKLIIHSQINLTDYYPNLDKIIQFYLSNGTLEIIEKTVPAPGLYTVGDVYVYPSKLEGIGLTVAEAVSSGLCLIVPDCAPMNEFVHLDFGRVVKVERLFARSDGYYWPQNHVDVKDLARVMGEFIISRSCINEMKYKARKYAETNLNWKINSTTILDVLKEENVQDNYLISNAIDMINKFEKSGIRKYNKYLQNLYWIYNLKFKK